MIPLLLPFVSVIICDMTKQKGSEVRMDTSLVSDYYTSEIMLLSFDHLSLVKPYITCSCPGGALHYVTHVMCLSIDPPFPQGCTPNDP